MIPQRIARIADALNEIEKASFCEPFMLEKLEARALFEVLVNL